MGTHQQLRAHPLPLIVAFCLLACIAIAHVTLGVPIRASDSVVTVLATDVGLWTQPDTLASMVSVNFTINGNPVQSIVYVSGEVPVLEADVPGMDGTTRWTRVSYSGYIGPDNGGVSFAVTGYLRNDLISVPHPPGMSAP